jgi:CheY-like chemotaxis protein
MPPTNPRIIVVDDNKGIYNIVRASLELLGRKPRLIETQSSDDALLELRISSADLLVTAQTVSGIAIGPVLALSAKRELAALPVIVLGSETDPEMDAETVAQSPFQYLRRPLPPEAFIRALRVALDGPEAVPQQAVQEDMLGPVPIIDIDKVRPLLFQVMRDVGAMAAVLADRNGKVISYEGAAGYVDRDLLAATLGPSFSSTTRILSVIGDQPRVLKYYDGEKLDLFGLAVGLHYFVTLVFDNKAGANLGNVKRYGGNAINSMLEIIGTDIAYSVKPAPVVPVAPPAPNPKEAAPTKGRKRRTTQEMPAVVAEAIKPAARQPEPEPSKPMFEPIANFDPSLLDALENIDLSTAEDLFSEEKLSANAGASGNRISFEDAMMQGIIGDVDQ